MVYGWGSDSEHWGMSDGSTVVFAYRYVSLMFFFRLAYKKRWLVLADNRSQDVEISRAELEQRYGPSAPSPGIWGQYSLLIGVTAFSLLVLAASMF